MSAARDRWLDEGVEVLAAEGAAGVRIDRLAARLGLSKGSFHHHFAGAEGYKRDLLDHVESIMTNSFEHAVGSAGGEPSTRQMLARLTEMVTASDDTLYRPTLELALRSWALSDAEAASAQARIDEARLAALRAVWRRVSDDEGYVRQAAMLPYILALGATVIMPPLNNDDIRKLYELILPLAPHDPPGRP